MSIQLPSALAKCHQGTTNSEPSSVSFLSKSLASHPPISLKVGKISKQLGLEPLSADTHFDDKSLERVRVWKVKVAPNSPKEISDGCIHTFCEHLSQLSHAEAEIVFARYLFLFAKKPQALQKVLSSKAFPELVTFLEKETVDSLKEIANKFHPQKSKIADVFKFQGLIYENRYAIEITRVLLRQDGTLNVGLIEDVKKQLLISGSKATSLDKHLLLVLDDLKKPEVQVAFAKIGKTNEDGQQIVRATLCLQANIPPTLAQVRTAALATFLSRLRHLDFHNCYAYAVNLTVKACIPENVFLEYGSILEKGASIRVIDDKECTFLAAPKMALFILNKELSSSATAKKLWEHSHLALAFTTIGASEQAVSTAIHTTVLQNLPFTLESIFNTLQTQLPAVTQANLQKAYFIAAAASEMPLSRVWNNAISSMFFTPFTMKYKQITSHNVFKISILRTLARSIEQTKDPKAATLVALVTQHTPRLAKAKINGEDFSALLPHFRKLQHETLKLSEKDRIKLIQKDKELTKIRPHDPVGLFNTLLYITEDMPKGTTDLTAQHFAALENLRIFVEPPSSLKRSYAECCLYIQEGDSFTKITSSNALGKALKKIFVSIVTEMKETTIAHQIGQLSDMSIAQKFQSFFTPLLSCDASGSFDVNYDNTPWSFMLAPAYFDTFWGVYFAAPKIDTPSNKINFTNNPNAAQELLEWAEKMRASLGADPKTRIPAKYPGNIPYSAYPGHAITLTPNHPTMIPPLGKTVEMMLQEKMAVVKSLTIVNAKTTVKEAKTWAEEYLTKSLKDTLSVSKLSQAIQKFKNEMAHLENNPALRLEVYLDTLCKKVTALIEDEEISALDLDELSNFCLQALLTDIPGAEESIIVHFGDSMWEHQPQEKTSLPIEACFYPNLVTKKWSTIYLASSDKYDYVKLFQPPELTIYTK